jgi:hypothetical protein
MRPCTGPCSTASSVGVGVYGIAPGSGAALAGGVIEADAVVAAAALVVSPLVAPPLEPAAPFAEALL